MRASTADTVRGTVTCVTVGVSTILTPASRLPHGFGYYAAAAAFLLGLRFGARAIGMLFVCCVAIGVAEVAGQGVCTPSSNSYRCGFEAAAPLLIFGYFVFPTIAGALLGGLGRLSRGVSRRALLQGPHDSGTLHLGHTLVVAMAAAGAAFIALALIPRSGAPLLLPALAACVAFGLAPSYGIGSAPTPPARADAPTW
jgi:hypothetical protein